MPALITSTSSRSTSDIDTQSKPCSQTSNKLPVTTNQEEVVTASIVSEDLSNHEKKCHRPRQLQHRTANTPVYPTFYLYTQYGNDTIPMAYKEYL